MLSNVYREKGLFQVHFNDKPLSDHWLDDLWVVIRSNGFGLIEYGIGPFNIIKRRFYYRIEFVCAPCKMEHGQHVYSSRFFWHGWWVVYQQFAGSRLFGPTFCV